MLRNIIDKSKSNNKKYSSKEGASLVAQTIKDLPAMWETQVWEDPLEKGILQYSCLENSIDRGA